jgi:hypothetical protein
MICAGGNLLALLFYLTTLNPPVMKKLIVYFICCILLAVQSWAQDNTPVHFAAYEHRVKPTMTRQYWESMKKVKSNSSQHKIAAIWASFQFDDNTYIHFMPIKNFADLDKDPFDELSTKMGKDQHEAMWKGFDPCMESTSSYVLTFYPGLSYLRATGQENFRDVFFWTILPGKELEAETLLKEWAKVYESKKVPTGFETYKVTFGSEPAYAIVSWAKDELDMAVKRNKTRELMGDDMLKMNDKTMAITLKYNTKRGSRLPDVSYSPPAGSQ